MKKLFYILIITAAFSSCSPYHKAVKSTDVTLKYAMGTEMYDAGKYSKANRLFTQIVPQYRGKPQAEKLMYMYSKTFYEMREYYTSNYHMERFVNAYPDSEKAEEMAYLGAKSYYFLSPVYTKEQKETVDAIQKMQSFINQYPESEHLVEANALVKELDDKLEIKAFSIAKQYNLISDYQACIKSFDNFIIEFPGTIYKEEAMYYRFDAAYKLAINSVESKKLERITNAISNFNIFQKEFAESEYMEDANEMMLELNTMNESYKTKS